jgi:hypothetical protein|tara:strand:+ start:1156 stop:1461 length:306 start_codon:yes stop_codon:yes gene_type:complete
MIDRYKNIKKISTEDNEQYYLNPIYPDIPETEEDIYVITTGGDRYDTLAQQFYKDSSLWWAIASANTSVRDNLVVKPGVQLRIPLSKQRVLQLYRSVNSNR